jgi:hypothetical protein
VERQQAALVPPHLKELHLDPRQLTQGFLMN